MSCGIWVHPGSSFNFSINYSPVNNSITFQKFYWATKVNIETVILYGDLDKEIYMECPQGMLHVQKDDLIILNKCIFGLVSAAWLIA